MNIKEKAVEIGLQSVAKALLFFTPNNIIKAIDELVELAENTDMTGEEKFMYVFREARDFLAPIFRFAIVAIIEILVKDMNTKLGVNNGN